MNIQHSVSELKKKDIDIFENIIDETIQIKLIIDLIIARGQKKLYDNYIMQNIPSHLAQIILNGIRNAIEIYGYPHDDNAPIYPYRAFQEDSEPVRFIFS